MCVCVCVCLCDKVPQILNYTTDAEILGGDSNLEPLALRNRSIQEYRTVKLAVCGTMICQKHRAREPVAQCETLQIYAIDSLENLS